MDSPPGARVSLIRADCWCPPCRLHDLMQVITRVIATFCYPTCRHCACKVLPKSSFYRPGNCSSGGGVTGLGGGVTGPPPQPGSSCVQEFRACSDNSNGAGLLSVLVSTLMRCWCELKGLRFPELSSLKGQLDLLIWKLKASEFSIGPGAQVYQAGNPPRDFR